MARTVHGLVYDSREPWGKNTRDKRATSSTARRSPFGLCFIDIETPFVFVWCVAIPTHQNPPTKLAVPTHQSSVLGSAATRTAFLCPEEEGTARGVPPRSRFPFPSSLSLVSLSFSLFPFLLFSFCSLFSLLLSLPLSFFSLFLFLSYLLLFFSFSPFLLFFLSFSPSLLRGVGCSLRSFRLFSFLVSLSFSAFLSSAFLLFSSPVLLFFSITIIFFFSPLLRIVVSSPFLFFLCSALGSFVVTRSCHYLLISVVSSNLS